MYASTPTKLDLPTWAKIMGLNPLHFGQVQLGSDANDNTPNCDSPWIQHEWQGADGASREEIARCIFEAESMIEHQLGYRLLPSWEVDEWHPSERGNITNLFNLTGTDLRGFSQSVKARWGWFVVGGIRAQSLIGADLPIVYTDANDDGYFETATITFTPIPAGLTVCDVHAYYPGHAGDAGFEIRPIVATIEGDTLTVVIRRELLVVEEIIEEFDPRAAVSDDDDNFLAELDLYRIYNDPSTQATLLWENRPGTCNCGTTSCAQCQYTAQTACLMARGDPRDSMLGYWPGNWSIENQNFAPAYCSSYRQADGVRLWYYAGLRDKSLACPSNVMDRDWQIKVAHFAAALLDRPPCGCVAEQWGRWAADLAATGGAEELETYTLTASDLGNPFGTRRGQIMAWRKIVKEPDAANARFAWPA